MVLILDGNPEVGAYVRRNLCYLICLRHATCLGLPSNISTMGKTFMEELSYKLGTDYRFRTAYQTRLRCVESSTFVLLIIGEMLDSVQGILLDGN